MGHLLPGGHFKRFGESLINHTTAQSITSVPSVKPLFAGSITNTQGRIT
jgi:hypothetical protein